MSSKKQQSFRTRFPSSETQKKETFKQLNQNKKVADIETLFKLVNENPNGYETPSQLNIRDTSNRARSNHTGTQLASTISNFSSAVLATILAGLSVSTAQVITSTDTVLQAFGYLQAQISLRVVSNSPITGATKTKITYDSKGLVTSGTDATTADINDSTNRRYVTDANLTVINNTSGVNSGNETASTIATIGHGATLDTSPLDADEVMGLDSSNSFSLIRTTWTSIKAFLKTYFDAFYQPLSVARSYTTVSLANNTARTPSSTRDVLIILTPSLQAGIGQTAQIIVQVDDSGGGTFTTIATSANTNALTITLGLLGGSSTQAQPITFKVPKTSQYRYVTSGTGTVTILQHFQLLD